MLVVCVVSGGSLSNGQSGGSPEGGGPTPTPNKYPDWFPTRPPRANPRCTKYIFSIFHAHRYNHADGVVKNIYDFAVDQVTWNGKKLFAYKPNSVFAPGSKLDEISSADRGLYQPAGNLPDSLANGLGDWFKNSLTTRYTEAALDAQAAVADNDLLDDLVLTDWWRYVCQHAPDNFTAPYVGGRTALCTASEGAVGWLGEVQAKSREIFNVPGTYYGPNWVENYILDANGIPQPYKTIAQLAAAGEIVCDAGMAFMMQSPISLILDDTWDIDSDVRMTQFPLDPNRKGEWFLWKASAKAPLLVYDPEHTGSITSATQLFGNWTFGGKRVAMANPSEVKGSSTWEHGYEALGSLDVDGNGEVSGEELQPLGLWADANQNGVSEPGEVTPIRARGITKLFYNVKSGSNGVADIHLAKGFERVVDGVTREGRSVDWMSPRSSSPYGLMGKVNLLGDDEFDIASEVRTVLNEQPSQGDSNSVGAYSNGRRLYGAWEWKLDGDTGNAAFGTMIFVPTKEGKVRGINMAVVAPPAENPWPDVAGFMQVASFGIDVKSDGSAEFVSVAPGGSFLRNTIKASGDPNRLVGTTKASTKVDGKEVTVSYKWTAKKVQMAKAKPEKRAGKPSKRTEKESKDS